jgi:CysZ protein
MFAVIESIFGAFKGLFAPGMGKIFLGCVTLTFLVLLALNTGLSYATGWALEYYGAGIPTWASWLLSSVGFFLLLTLLFPLLMPILVSFFDEQIAGTVERDAYPALAIGVPQPFWADIRADVAFTIKAIVLNILIFPLIIAGPLYFIAYYLLNSFLLGTQFFMMAGGRHIGKPAARDLAGKHRGRIMLAGLAIIIAAQIPFLNLIAPLWGVALMVHLYQRTSPPAQVITPQ